MKLSHQCPSLDLAGHWEPRCREYFHPSSLTGKGRYSLHRNPLEKNLSYRRRPMYASAVGALLAASLVLLSANGAPPVLFGFFDICLLVDTIISWFRIYPFFSSLLNLTYSWSFWFLYLLDYFKIDFSPHYSFKSMVHIVKSKSSYCFIISTFLREYSHSLLVYMLWNFNLQNHLECRFVV